MRNAKALDAQLTEEACLQALLRLQHGDGPCKACDTRAGYAFVPKRRALACRACGLMSFPTVGSPFARPEPTLRHWFLAIYIVAGQDRMTARDLRRELGVPVQTAEFLHSGAEQLKAESEAGMNQVDWFDGVRDFTENLAAQPEVLRTAETLAQRRNGLLAALAERWQYVAIGGIAGLAALAAGIGWLLVPEVPEEDQELVQATAILSLASDRPVLIVSAEVAEQLYEVEDIEADSSSSVMPSIRLAPSVGDSKAASLAEAKPLSAPSVKLAPSIGQSLLKGDLSAVKDKGGRQRPELAAYNALALELEAKGPRNPDELLAFGPMKIRRHLVEKIIRASRLTQVDPVLLMAIADKESSFATEIQAQTSSATGLFQFIERTWLGVVRDFGTAYGLDREARLVQSGPLAPAERTRILDLRRDAYLSAIFAAEMLKRDSLRIQRRIGRPLTGGEVYLVHFLGPDGAERLIDRVANAPTLAAAELLPKPAEANKTIFYTSAPDGGAKKLSVSEVKDKFETMISLRLDRYRNVHGVAAGDKNRRRGEQDATRRTRQ
ncbi:transglycosylase SLT domain-containing protein [Enterovirga aerilata]